MADTPPPPEPLPESVGGTVLCIEDHPVTMALVEALVGHFPDIALQKAATGREGVRLAIAEQPDLILLDLNLPDIDGLEVLRQLCEPIAAGRLSAVLVTADSFSIRVAKAMTLGVREYWVKPLTLGKLTSALPRALRRARADRARSRRH